MTRAERVFDLLEWPKSGVCLARYVYESGGVARFGSVGASRRHRAFTVAKLDAILGDPATKFFLCEPEGVSWLHDNGPQLGKLFLAALRP